MVNKSSKNDIHKSHRARMKQTYLKTGIDGFSDIEKLEFLLFFAVSRKDTNPIAHNLLNKFETINKVFEASISELTCVEGIGEHSAILIHLFFEMFNQYGKSKCLDIIKNVSSAKEYARNLYNGINIEQFYTICLNNSGRVLGRKMISSGTASEAPVNIRDVVEFAVNNKCEKVILIHNHPNADATPSQEDFFLTARIIRSLMELNINVVDHIIVGDRKCTSFLEYGVINEMRKDSVKDIMNSGDRVSDKLLQQINGSRSEY